MESIKMPKVAVVYTRTSTDSQGRSLESQEEICKEYIKKKEYTYLKTYKDENVSGKKLGSQRPGMRSLLKDMKEGEFDIIVFYSFDRLARDTKVADQLIKLFGENEIQMNECEHDFDIYTSDGQRQMAMHFHYAALELIISQKRSAIGRNTRKKKLGWIGGPVPFGYQKPDNHKDSLPIVNKEEAKIVNLIYAMYWKYNYLVSKIPVLLNAQKISTGQYSKNKVWSLSMVIRILKDHKNKYEGSLLNGNESGIRWPLILRDVYPNYPKIKTKKKDVKQEEVDEDSEDFT